jgi:hypothetical protein
VTNLAQEWVNTPATNFGLITKYAVENINAEKYFGSSENSTSGDRPQLTITYSLPSSSFTTSNKTITCASGSGVSIGSSAISGLTYNWSPAAGLSSTTTSNPTANPTSTTTYTVTVTNACGCSVTNTVTVTVNKTPPTANAGSNQTIVCPATSTNIGSAAVSGNSYAWLPTTGLSASNIANPVASPTANTIYTVTVTGSNGCTATSSVHVSYTLCPVTYNPALPYNSTEEFINKVQIGSINNTSGNNGGYANFSAQTVTLVKGSTTQLKLNAGFVGSTRTEYWRVWVDWNYDGDYTDAGEQVVSGTSSGTNQLTLNLTVPSSAVEGYPVRMRIVMRRSSYASSATLTPGSGEKGEVEDYTIMVAPAGARVTLPEMENQSGMAADDEKISAISIYPNPVSASQQEITLQYELIQNGLVDIAVYSLDGKLMAKQQFDGNEGENRNIVKLPALSAGMYNMFVVTKYLTIM